MKKLVFLLLLLPIVVFSQKTEDELYPPKILNFEKFNATPTNYEVPYMRYCLHKTSNLRITSYALSASCALAFYSKGKYTKEYFLGNHDRKFLPQYETRLKVLTIGAWSIGASSLVTYIISEKWFRKSSIMPVVDKNGIGVILKF